MRTEIGKVVKGPDDELLFLGKTVDIGTPYYYSFEFAKTHYKQIYQDNSDPKIYYYIYSRNSSPKTWVRLELGCYCELEYT